ncbi:MAG: hypothetical protein CVV27_10370 [Candidatus Melainabacteria bacterium HGW-Melainabacteria-1]|nr:MAG: hypothetical protein CVV27_10370 [Candidatus Melainabacteria bacterium HGW-Melainabacteria-1]
MTKPRYLYTVHHAEGAQAFCYKGPLTQGNRLRMPARRIPYRSLMLPSILDQDGFFTELKAIPISAAAHWVDGPEPPTC